MTVEIIRATIMVLTIAVIGRALLSWVPMIFGPHSSITEFLTRGPIGEFLITVTEPILAPIRSVMPRGLMIDFSPIIAIFLLQIIGNILISNLQ